MMFYVTMSYDVLRCFIYDVLRKDPQRKQAEEQGDNSPQGDVA